MRKLAILLAVVLFLSACAAAPDQVAGSESPSPVGTAQAVAMPTTSANPTGAPPVVEAATAPLAEATEPAQGTQGMATFAILPEESRVTYQVDEIFIREGNLLNTAIGSTSGVTGEVEVNFESPAASTFGPINFDASRFTSDSPRRDGAIRERFLQSAQYPTVTFTPTAVDGLPEAIVPGEEYTFTLTGDLTIRDVTQPAKFDVQAMLDGDFVRGTAQTVFLMSDFGFGPIDILGVLKTEDEVGIAVDFVAAPLN